MRAPSIAPSVSTGVVPQSRARTIGSLVLSAAASALMSCSESTAPTPPAARMEVSAAAANGGQSICSWGLSDFTGNGEDFLSSDMNPDQTYQIGFYNTDLVSFIDSKPTAGLTTVFDDTLVVVNGNLPATQYFPDGTEVAIVLALDLRLVVSPRQGTGLHPEQGGKDGTAYTRFMQLTGTIDGVQISSGSGISDKMSAGRPTSPPPRGASPSSWFGTNGSVQFCKR